MACSQTSYAILLHEGEGLRDVTTLARIVRIEVPKIQKHLFRCVLDHKILNAKI